ncbi:MAG: hypothetical protein RBS57_07635 [Desulforhabdus sp.]|nr:hypothetical protein [Desulforhabdus sp.]
MLVLFAENKEHARIRYSDFVRNGLSMGKRPEFTGGGLVRSAGGWSALRSLRQMKIHLKSDERILGDSEFVDSVLAAARETMEGQYRLKARGVSFDTIVARVSQIFDVPEERIRISGKERKRVNAKSIAAYWAVRELGMAGTEVGRQLGLTQSAVSRSVRRGEDIVKELGIFLTDYGIA